MSYEQIVVPEGGERIRVSGDTLAVPHTPYLAYIEGDGTGPDITRACLRIWDAAVERAYAGKRSVKWVEIYAGEKAASLYGGDYFPGETLEAIKEFTVAIKGPLTTPVGGWFRSLNV